MKRPIVAEDLLKLRFVSDPQISPDGKRIAYTMTHIDEKSKDYKTELWLVEGEKAPYRLAGAGNSNPLWSPDGRNLVFVSNRSGSRQLWLLRNGFGEAEQLTTMRYGAGNPQWSPDGKKLLFVSAVGKEDTPEELTKELGKEGMEKLRLAQANKPYVVDGLRYKMDGAGLLPKRNGQLWVLDLQTKSVKQITSFEHPAGSPAWSPCGNFIAFAANLLENAEDHPTVSDIYVMPAEGGEPTKLTKSEGSARAPIWSLDGKDIVYLWNNQKYKGASLSEFYRISAQGGEPRCLTPGLEMAIGMSANSDSRFGGGSMSNVWATNGYIYFVSADKGHANLHRFCAEGGAVEQVSCFRGAIYAFTFDAEGKKAAVALSEPLSPGDLYSFDLITKESVRLTEANDEFLNSVALSEPEEFNCLGPDDWNVQGWVMKPINFEPDKKYPAILEIHGGPHTMFGDVFFFEFQYLCSKGYTVIYTNPRGSHGYGQEFVNACRGDYGGKDYGDLMAATDWAVENLPFVDAERLGVTGGSYGGFMTNWIVGQTHRFKAAVTQRSISNWTSFTGSADIGSFFTEFEHEANPWDDPDKMVKHSPLTYVKNIETPLLIIHGEQDLRCPIEQAEQLFVFMKRLKKEVLFLRFPGATHELSRSGKPTLRIERLKAIAGWFDKYIPKAE